MNNSQGKLWVVGTPIGNLQDFSPRGISALTKADIIAAEDTRVTRKLLSHFQIHTPLISYHQHNEGVRGAELIERILKGETVAVVSDAGMPCISDPGEVLVSLAHKHFITVEVFPSCNAAIAALAISGISTKRFTFEGFLPSDKGKSMALLTQVESFPHTLIFYESPHRLATTLQRIWEVLGDRNISICRELTKIHEEVLRGTLSEMVEYYKSHTPKGEFVLVVEGNNLPPKTTTIEEVIQVAKLLKSEGLKLSEACSQAVRGTKFSKSQVYKQLLQEESL